VARVSGILVASPNRAVFSAPRNFELRVFGSLADAKALSNERVWRTDINATVNEGGYGTDYGQ
jgi:hypothetical protein